MPASLEEFCITGVSVNISQGINSFSFKGKVISFFGIYLLIETDISPEDLIKAGDILYVSILAGEEQQTFESKTWFFQEQRQLCLKLPPRVTWIERRKHLRITAELPIYYSKDGLEVKSKTINISAGGVYFFTPEHLSVGQPLIIRLLTPNGEFILQTVVVRTMLNAATVEFSEKNNADYGALVEFISSLI